MMRPARLLMIGVLALGAYMGFYAVPGDNASATAFSPEQLAAQEIAVWQAAEAHQEFSAYMATALMLREQNRYTWFRAVQASYYLARAHVQFVNMGNRFERVLPDLTEAAAIETAYTKVNFDPAEAARAQLNWWVTNKVQTLGTTDDVASLMAEEWGLRYNLPAGGFLAATKYRAEAVKLRDRSKVDPDWNSLRTLLEESYRALQLAIEQGRTRRATGR